MGKKGAFRGKVKSKLCWGGEIIGSRFLEIWLDHDHQFFVLFSCCNVFYSRFVMFFRSCLISLLSLIGVCSKTNVWFSWKLLATSTGGRLEIRQDARQEGGVRPHQHSHASVLDRNARDVGQERELPAHLEQAVDERM